MQSQNRGQCASEEGEGGGSRLGKPTKSPGRALRSNSGGSSGGDCPPPSWMHHGRFSPMLSLHETR